MHFGGKTGCIEKMFVKLEMTRASPGSSLVLHREIASMSMLEQLQLMTHRDSVHRVSQYIAVKSKFKYFIIS